jgi:hypothetical protein
MFNEKKTIFSYHTGQVSSLVYQRVANREKKQKNPRSKPYSPFAASRKITPCVFLLQCICAKARKVSSETPMVSPGAVTDMFPKTPW